MVSWYHDRRKSSLPAASSPSQLIDECARLESRVGIVTVTPDVQNLDFVQSEIERLVRPGDIVQRASGAVQIIAAGADYDGVRAIASRLKTQLKDVAGHVYGTSEEAKSFKERLKESSVLRMAVGLNQEGESEFSGAPLSKDELVQRVTEAYAINPLVFTKAQVTYFLPKENETADYIQFEPWQNGAHIPADYPKLLRPTVGKKPARFEYDVKTRMANGSFVVFAKRPDDDYQFNEKTGLLKKDSKSLK